jgi:hypothetical protein
VRDAPIGAERVVPLLIEETLATLGLRPDQAGIE